MHYNGCCCIVTVSYVHCIFTLRFRRLGGSVVRKTLHSLEEVWEHNMSALKELLHMPLKFSSV